MKASEQIAGRVREVLLDGTWIANTNVRAQIEALDWRDAVRTDGTTNSIAALTFHIHYYVAGHLNVLRGGSLDIRDKLSFDMPPVQSADDWQQMVDVFIRDSEDYVKAIAELDDQTLEMSFTDPKYGTWRRNLEAIIEHSYYHLGQISLLRKKL